MADSDDEITAEDVAFFQKRAKTASFLLREQGADPEATSKAQKRIQLERSAAARRKERAAIDRMQGRDGGGGDDEGDDEGPRRNLHWQAEAEKERRQALPVKLADGSMKAVMREQALPDPDEAVELPAMSKRAQKRARGERIAEKKALERGEVLVKPGAKHAEEKPHAAPAPTEAKKEGARGQQAGAGAAAQEERPLTHEEKKAAIADLCSKLMRDPEKSVGLLTRVHQFCNDKDASIVKMALLSEATVFADILPDYRIRQPTDKEKEIKVSKEVAQQRAYEASLLASYQRFLQFLESSGRRAEGEAQTLWERGGEAAVQGSMLAIVVSAMVLLQRRRPTFNFANNLLQSLARRADAPVPAIANMALSGLRDTMISSPLNGHIKMCVEVLAESVKKKQQRVNVQVLEVFLALKITSDMLSGPNKKKIKGDTEEANEERELEQSLLGVFTYAVTLYTTYYIVT
jgi:nucleolar complex protein 3